MRALRLSILLLVLPLAACQADGLPVLLGPSKEEIAAKKAELAAEDDNICRSYGAKPGTDIYVECRVRRQQSRDAGDNAIAAASVSAPAIVNNAGAPPPSYPTLQPIVNPGPRCTSRGC
jgi:hypothetical protein